MNFKKLLQCFFLLILVFGLLGVIAGVGYILLNQEASKEENGEEEESTSEETTSSAEDVTMNAFLSENDFNEYLHKAESSYYSDSTGSSEFLPQAAIDTVSEKEELRDTQADRYSQTNVQVEGIDEPDVVKTDGKFIYYSPRNINYYKSDILLEELQEKTTPPLIDQTTKLIRAFPYENLEEINTIDTSGNLLLYDKTLIIITNTALIAFDVTSAKTPQKLWDIELESTSNIDDVRLLDKTLYVVTKTYIDTEDPCPIEPLARGKSEVNIKCTQIYHPSVPVSFDVTYTIMKIHPKKGSVDDQISFVGSSSSSVIYMSENSIYVTYSYTSNFVTFLYNFFKDRGSDLIPATYMNRIEKLMSYDISDSAKMVEFETIMNEFQSSLDEDRKLEVETELSKRMTEYAKQRKRELETTGIVKVSTSHLEIQSHGHVPGVPLNQFSLDEYNDHLRIATTIGGYFSLDTSEMVNDVYILDSSLNTKSSALDLGEGERIYAVRFLRDRGYVVTFMQIDPFYVLDLSNPEKIEVEGELKIPGYSSYLHPINENIVLGVGKEEQRVKLSLFDVSDPKNPIEKDKYELDEYWTDVSDTHHAFLLDSKHEVFFIPAGSSGYIFSYTNDQLKLKKAVSKFTVERAIYIDDYMYLIGPDKVIVLFEDDWKQVNKFDLS